MPSFPSDYASLGDIPAGGRVGTGSLRRKVQVLHRRPDLEVVHLRGNVETRLRKLETEGLDAIILAAAGLKRLGLGHVPRGFLTEEEMLPAIAQGALGLEVRAADAAMLELLNPLNHLPSQVAVTAERAFLGRLEGGCLVPVAALGTPGKRRLQPGGPDQRPGRPPLPPGPPDGSPRGGRGHGAPPGGNAP